MILFLFEIYTNIIAQSIIGANNLISQNINSKKQHLCQDNNHDYDSIYPAIIVDSILDQKLQYIGGINHWFHVAERLIPYIDERNTSFCTNSTDRLYILFQDEQTVHILSPFIRFLFTSIFYCKNINEVIFGYLPSPQYLSCNYIESRFVVTSFAVNIKEDQLSSLFTQSYSAFTFIDSKEIKYYLNQAVKLSWDKQPSKRIDLFSNSYRFIHFQKSVSHICQLQPMDNDISDLIDESKNSSDQKKHGTLLSRPRTMKHKVEYTILIYQRDLTRKIKNIDEVIDFITKIATEWNLQSTSRIWNVNYFIHSDHISPCQIIQVISKATIMITPHGFQSILLLFQPSSSIFIEIFPFYYTKPGLFSKVQESIQSSVKSQRSYHYVVSPPTTSIFQWIRWFGISNSFCLRFHLCRYFSRLENVQVPLNDLHSILSFKK